MKQALTNRIPSFWGPKAIHFGGLIMLIHSVHTCKFVGCNIIISLHPHHGLLNISFFPLNPHFLWSKYNFLGRLNCESHPFYELYQLSVSHYPTYHFYG